MAEEKTEKKAEHYYTKVQTSPFNPKKVMMNALGMEIEVYTAAGVFSPTQLDTGTRLLIKYATVKKEWKVLDLGCGYGIVGIALKRKNPSISLVMSDVNERAVELSIMNLQLNRIKAEAMQSDIFENPRLDAMRFDTILLNPPQTAGKQTCLKMIEESERHLVQGGMLQIVARHNKGGKSLGEHMESVFGNVQHTAKSAGYRIYASEKNR